LRMLMNTKSDFDEKLITTIDEVLKQIFGDAGLLIYAYLESQSVRREQIPEQLNDFEECLENFSASGSIVKMVILRNLYSRFGLEFEETGSPNNFTDHVAKLRNSLQQ